MSESDKAYKRVHGEKNPDTGGLPKLPDGCPDPIEDEKTFRHFLWEHIFLVRSHAKDIPLKPRKRLSPEDEAELRWNLEMMVYQARYALAYLKKRNE
jgi:hypothetical protein